MGSHTIQAGSTIIDKGNLITFIIEENEEVVFMANPTMGAFSARFNLKEMDRNLLSQ